MTTTATLTDRYIAATIKSLPQSAETDVRAELQALIADAVEARTEQGESPDDAERAVLMELGDPGVLAAGYADRPLYLIGPRYFLTWWRLLKLLLTIVPACVVGAVLLGQSLAGASLGEIVGTSIGAGVSTAVYIAFWVTVVFAVLERTGVDAKTPWELDRLPEPQDDTVGRSSTITSLVLLAIGAGALVWDHTVGFVRVDGRTLSVLDPEGWLVASLLVLVVAEAVLVVLTARARRWTTGLAVANTALAVLAVSLTISLLARGDLVNPEFVRLVLTDNGVDADAVRVLGVLTGFTIVGVAVGDVIDGWVKAWRARRH